MFTLAVGRRWKISSQLTARVTIWMVDPLRRTIAVYTSINDVTVVFEEQSLGGGAVLPGLTIPLPEVFAVLDRADFGGPSTRS